jgi:hypothetical protein
VEQFIGRFSGNLAMSEDSKRLRARAAKELRASRNGGSAAEKADNVKRAAALKALAINEEWLLGETATTKYPNDCDRPNGRAAGEEEHS